jgi:hypothetical protein
LHREVLVAEAVLITVEYSKHLIYQVLKTFQLVRVVLLVLLVQQVQRVETVV